jgi:hypothetical protein
MKKFTYISSLILVLSLTTNVYSAKTSDNTKLFNNKKCVEFFENGTVKLQIDTNRLIGYYNWVATSDTFELNMPILSWSMDSLLAFENTYRSLNLTDANKKFKLWMKNVRDDQQYALSTKSRYMINQRY